jgi:hypothetical protein
VSLRYEVGQAMLAGPCWAVLVKTAYGRGVLHCVHHHGSKWVGRTYAAQPAVTNNPSFRALPCASQPAGPRASRYRQGGQAASQDTLYVT